MEEKTTVVETTVAETTAVGTSVVETTVAEATVVKTGETQAAGKMLEEMDLLDDFLFGSVVMYPEIGERFVRSMLKTILGKEFKHLSVTAQKVFYGADTKLHGARLDVYSEPELDGADGQAAVYDIEPDQRDSRADRKALPRRVRFYHAKIAARSLESGAGYDDLKNVTIIMIMPYDPFGERRMMYTVKNKCVELPDMEYEDGASTLFFYTKGTEGIPSEAVAQLLHYMEDTTYENAVNEELREIHRMVETVKKDPEVKNMRILMLDEIIEKDRELAKQAEESARKDEEIARKDKELTRQAEESAKKEEELTKQAEEIARLREELERRNAMERAAKNHPEFAAERKTKN